MSLSATSRSHLIQGLGTVVPQTEALEEMLANFATRDADEWASKDFIRAEMAELRVELHTEIQRVILWSVGANVSMVALLFTLLRLTA